MQPTPSRKLQKPSRSADRVYQAVKSMAVTYEIRPGERINEVELANHLKVSRTPLREALNRLVIEGIVASKANRGFYIPHLDVNEIFALYEFRCAVETSAVRLACERATPDAIAKLERFVRSSAEAEDDGLGVNFLKLDEEFHESLMRLSGNNEFLRALKNVNSRIHFVRWIDIQHGGRTQTQREHLKIVRAIKRKDVEKAMQLVDNHISRRLSQIIDVIKAGYAEIYTNNVLARETRAQSRP